MKHRLLPECCMVWVMGLVVWAGIASIAWAQNAAVLKHNVKSNFVIILCDDLGYGDLSCYGHPVIRTPNLDALAREGLRLSACYAAAPVCSPARAGMLTGRTPNRCGIYDWIPEGSPMHLRTSEVTIATLLRAAGYATCFVGKWHNNGLFNSPRQPQPGAHGFDYWFATQNNAQPSHCNPVNFVRNDLSVGPLKGYSSTLIVDEAISWLKACDRDRPFCLFVWFHSPHEPIATAEEFVERYRDIRPKERAEYFGNVTQMDHEMGRLLKTIDELGMRDDTFVLFTSDNGPETLNRYRGSSRSYGSPGPLRGMKLHLYEGGIRVPGIIRWPGRTRAGEVSDEPVNGTDVLPTLCEIAVINTPADRTIDGASILPIFKGEPVERKVPLYWQYDKAISTPKVAMRKGDWKILASSNLDRFELYDLRADPGETTNLADEQPLQLQAMAARLNRLHSEVGAEGLKWPKFQRRYPQKTSKQGSTSK